MIKTFKIGLLALLMTGLHAKDAQGKNLKKVYQYPASTFHLKYDENGKILKEKIVREVHVNGYVEIMI